MRWGKLVSASENFRGPNSSWISQMHQLRQHPSQGQGHTLAMHDHMIGSLNDQQLVFGQIWPVMGMGSTDHHLGDGKSLSISKAVVYFNQLTLFGDQ